MSGAHERKCVQSIACTWLVQKKENVFAKFHTLMAGAKESYLSLIFLQFLVQRKETILSQLPTHGWCKRNKRTLSYLHLVGAKDKKSFYSAAYTLLVQEKEMFSLSCQHMAGAIEIKCSLTVA